MHSYANKWLRSLVSIVSVLATTSVAVSAAAAPTSVGYLLSGTDVSIHTTETQQSLKEFFKIFKVKPVSLDSVVDGQKNLTAAKGSKPQTSLYIYDLEKTSTAVLTGAAAATAEKHVVIYTHKNTDSNQWELVISAPNRQLLMSLLRRLDKSGLAALVASEEGAVVYSADARPLAIISTESEQFVANWMAAQPPVSSEMRDWHYIAVNSVSAGVPVNTDVLTLIDQSKLNSSDRQNLAPYVPVTMRSQLPALSGNGVVVAVQQSTADGANTLYSIAAKDKGLLSSSLKRFTHVGLIPKVLTSYPRLFVGRVAKLGANAMPDWSPLPQTVLSNWKHQGAGSPLTGIRMGYDATWLYVRIDCEDSGSITWMSRDEMNLWEQDVAEIFVDAGCDEMDYYEFEWNPLGAKVDLEVVWAPDGRWRGSREWDAKGSSHTVKWGKVNVQNKELKGWVVETKIPIAVFSDRKAMPKSGDVWLGGIYRIERDTPAGSAYLTWSPLPGNSIAFHQPKSFGFWQFE